MSKLSHEIRDPIHTFIHISSDEKKVVDSKPFQRLRHIHQLALTYLIYPGATHKRFEHSLGVMELASRVYDVITHPENIHINLRDKLDESRDQDQCSYWRKALRVAALCHDIGHLPFSHAAEVFLLPEGWTHERLTVEFIRSEEMKNIWEKMIPPLNTEHIVKLAVGEKDLVKFDKYIRFTPWEKILSEIIVGNVFGVDRMDYLLRDSHHTGVAYGKFDHFRLIDTLRILPKPSYSYEGEKCMSEIDEPVLGVEDGGLYSAEALLLARYFMFSQVYLHPVRRMYDLHLKEFLQKYLPEGRFPTDISQLINITDNEITSALFKSCHKPESPGADPASRICERNHFKLIYQKNPEDDKKSPYASRRIYEALCNEFGIDNFRYDDYNKGAKIPPFPVQSKTGRLVWAHEQSRVLNKIPGDMVIYVFVDKNIFNKAKKWLNDNLDKLLSQPLTEEENYGRTSA